MPPRGASRLIRVIAGAVTIVKASVPKPKESSTQTMAPTTSANSNQAILATAVQKLADAVNETGNAPNSFSKKLLELMELTSKIQQFEEVAELASKEASSDEAQKWQEISLMTLKHCCGHLLEQRQKTLAELQKLAQNGGSLFKEPEAIANPQESAVKPPPGLNAPPGLSAPPGLGAPPGLSAPPGLALGASKEEVAPRKEEAPVAKKAWSAASAPWNKKKSSPQVSPKPSPVVPEKQPAFSAPCVMNLDAYDSD